MGAMADGQCSPPIVLPGAPQIDYENCDEGVSWMTDPQAALVAYHQCYIELCLALAGNLAGLRGIQPSMGHCAKDALGKAKETQRLYASARIGKTHNGMGLVILGSVCGAATMGVALLAWRRQSESSAQNLVHVDTSE